MSSHPVRGLSHAEYLALEARSEVKHEFLNGEILEMTGGTPEHAAVAIAIALQLGSELLGQPCRVYSSDLRVRVRETGLTAYPDLSVVCGELQTDAEDKAAVTNPALVVEVLSPTTEACDRGAKAAHYRHLASLRELMLVSVSERRIEVLRRNQAGRWELFEAGEGERIELASVGVTLDVSAVFRDPLSGS